MIEARKYLHRPTSRIGNLPAGNGLLSLAGVAVIFTFFFCLVRSPGWQAYVPPADPVERLGCGDQQARIEGARQLERQPRPDESAWKALTETYGATADPRLIQACLKAIWVCPGHQEEAQKLLRQSLREGEVRRRIELIRLLRTERELCRACLPDQMQLLSDKDPAVAREVILCLGRQNPESVKDLLPKLRELAAGGDPDLRLRAASLLLSLDPTLESEATRTIVEVVRASKQPGPLLSQLVMDSGRQIPGLCEPLLTAAEQTTSDDERSACVVAIAKAVPAQHLKDPAILSRWIALLTKELQSPRVASQTAALEAVRQMGPVAEATVPLVANLLRSRDPLVWRAAVRALGEMGDAARSALPQLEELRRRINHIIFSQEIGEALYKIIHSRSR